MNKLWLIVKREYLTRVRKKSFLITTILIPFIFGAFTILPTYLMSIQEDEVTKVAIIDKGDIMKRAIKDESDLYFSFHDKDLETMKQEVADGKYNGVLVIPKITKLDKKDFTVNYYSEGQLGLTTKLKLEQKIGRKIRDHKVVVSGMDQKELDNLKSYVNIDPEPIKEGGEDRSSITSMVLSSIGGILGMFMYMIILINGQQVMMGVMEEKTNRIVEVMISSVKPFQLMFGKILGIGAVTLTQVGIWALLCPLIFLGAQMFFGVDTADMQMDMATANSGLDEDEIQGMALKITNEIANVNWWLILPSFALYLLLGFVAYSSLYAAVGSAIGDDMGEAQKLTIPVIMPIILSIMILFPAISAPNSTLAVWSSIFPLSSPFIMPARLAFNPPFWQIALSLILLIATTIFFVWLSGRIYRVGIFLYGKKITFGEMWKWLFYTG